MLSNLRSIKRNIVDFIQSLHYARHSNSQALAMAKRLPHIHYICHGNICRSAFAEKYSLAFTQAHDIKMTFSSSGIAADQAKQPPPEAVRAASKLNVDLTGHVPLKTSVELLAGVDLVVGMHTRHALRFRQRFPQYGGSFYLLKHLAFPKYMQFNIHDPFNHGPDVFDHCFEEIKFCLDALIPRWTGSQGNGSFRKPIPPEKKLHHAGR